MEKLIKKTIEKLEKLKNNLSFDNEENYCEMVNIAVDYDNTAQDDLCLYDRILETVDFVSEEILPYYVEYQLKEIGIERIIYMAKDVTYADSIYKINDYGNLENVAINDFIYCINEALDCLKEKLREV